MERSERTMSPRKTHSRRLFLKSLGLGVLLAGVPALTKFQGIGTLSEVLAMNPEEKQGEGQMPEKIFKTEEEWKKILTPEQFNVLRKKGTERAFSGAYHDVKEKGFIDVPGVILISSVQIPSLIPEQDGRVSGRPSLKTISEKRQTTAFS